MDTQKCTKTVSGEHIWITRSVNNILSQRLNDFTADGKKQRIHYSQDYVQCFACDMIDDTRFDGKAHFTAAKTAPTIDS